MRVFITGGTGMIGSRLVARLRERGDAPVLLTRRPDAARASLGPEVALVEGDPTRAGRWMDEAAGCDAVINLAGENLFNKRWSDAFKQVMRDSRVRSTENVVAAMTRNPQTGKVLVNASAIGYYGPHGDEELTEDTPPGTDYLARLCVEWEEATRPAQAAGIRVALVRVGIVLAREAGALSKLLTPFKLGGGGPVGSGRQWMSWIYHEDMTELFLLALDNPAATGPLNGTAPKPVSNREFARALGRALHRPAIMPTPGFMLKLMLGEVADVVLNGQRVLPRKAVALGYRFKFPEIAAALADAVK
jgi:uncharacterized protein